MDAGELIPDEVVIGVVRERLSQDDTANRGFVLDGFPRTVHQAEALDGDPGAEGHRPGHRPRGRHRAWCSAAWPAGGCAATAGPTTAWTTRPKVNWTCDVCGGEVIQREDDTEGAIRRRLELYERETAPLIAWYSSRGALMPVEGMGSPDEVTARLVKWSTSPGRVPAGWTEGGRAQPAPGKGGRAQPAPPWRDRRWLIGPKPPQTEPSPRSVRVRLPKVVSGSAPESGQARAAVIATGRERPGAQGPRGCQIRQFTSSSMLYTHHSWLSIGPNAVGDHRGWVLRPKLCRRHGRGPAAGGHKSMV